MLNKVTRDVWASAVAQISCLNGSNGNAITELTQDDWDRAISYLDENETEKMIPQIEGSSAFGTGPVEAAFWATCHTKLKPDIRGLDAFQRTVDYGRQENVMDAEFGAVNDSRVLTSTIVTVSSDNPPVYNNTFIGADAVGIVRIDEVATETIIKPLGFNDYLNRYQAMGFTARFGAEVMDDSHIVTLLATKK